jgi:hypothetical protein
MSPTLPRVDERHEHVRAPTAKPKLAAASPRGGRSSPRRRSPRARGGATSRGPRARLRGRVAELERPRSTAFIDETKTRSPRCRREHRRQGAARDEHRPEQVRPELALEFAGPDLVQQPREADAGVADERRRRARAPLRRREERVDDRPLVDVERVREGAAARRLDAPRPLREQSVRRAPSARDSRRAPRPRAIAAPIPVGRAGSRRAPCLLASTRSAWTEPPRDDRVSGGRDARTDPGRARSS